MGTRMSSTSLLFSTKKRNFWGREEGTGGQAQREGQLCPTLSPPWECPQTLSLSLALLSSHSR